ncbi:MAG: hypothetical protein LQ340_007930, partial [Diploschistes diacapsis]
MRATPWLAVGISCAFVAVGSVLTCFLPETLPREFRSRKSNTATFSTADEDEAPAQKGKLLDRLARQVLDAARDAVHLFTESRGLAVVLPLFLFASFGQTSVTFLLQYASERFNWKIEQ